MRKIIGLVGLINSGKDSAADVLCKHHGFHRDSFASAVKDAVSAVFGWDRVLLEGRTVDARQWREQIDPWWASRLDIPHLTPRWVLQYWGTEVCRTGFHDDIWIASLEARLRNSSNNIVITDTRFPNEITSIRNVGGKVIRIQRGDDPAWLPIAILANNGDAESLQTLIDMNIHASERSWPGYPLDGIINNNSTLEDLDTKIFDLVGSLEEVHSASMVNLGREVAVGNWHKLL